jgi:hypothetical protein
LEVAMLVSRDEWEALRGMVRAEAREELARRLAQARENVADAGLDPAIVDEAMEAARKAS